MRTVSVAEQDLTGKARIRGAALELFAANGVAPTSLRAVAQAAEVSPALVVHHFGSKDGLCRAVDEAVVKRVELALSEVPVEEPGDGLLQGRGDAIVTLLRGQPVLCDYIGRALAEDTDASAALFHRLFESASRDRSLVEAGAIRAESDPFWRTIHQMLLVVGPLMMRRLIERELGGSLLGKGNFERWMLANTDLLQNGLYTGGTKAKKAKGRKKGKGRAK
jgi:TetR/AcrR family transcriptional regulator, regulator of cefoperazone and chloramphenicol sensitivity